MAYRILSETKFVFISDLAKLASAISSFYELEVIVSDADFNVSLTDADLHVITPNGRSVAVYHVSLYPGNVYWSLGGQTFITSDDMKELSKIREKERKD